MTIPIFNLTRFDNSGGVQAPILQGADFALTILYPDQDLTAYTPAGQIRKNYLYLNGELLANFSFDPLVYGVVTFPATGQTGNATTIIARLNNTITKALPIPILRESKNSKNTVGVNSWVYDIELQSPTSEILKLVKGLVEVCPEVTDTI